MKQIIYLLLTGIIALTLAACGGGVSGGSGGASVGTSTVRGVVSAGTALSGTVYLKDSSKPAIDKSTGKEISMIKEISKTINPDGSFSFDVTGLTKPFLLKAVASANATNANNYIMYSVADDAGTANINPLSHLVVTAAYGGGDLTALYNAQSMTDVQVASKFIADVQSIAANLAAATSEIQAKLQTLLSAYGIGSVNPISDPYTAKLDGMFDAVIIDVSNGNVTLTNKYTNAKFSLHQLTLAA